MSTDAGLNAAPSNPPGKSAARRMRNHRRRRRLGYQCVPLELGPAELDRLIAKGHLVPGDRHDPNAIAYGIITLIHGKK